MKQRYALQLENTPHPTLGVINMSAVFMTCFFGCLHTRLGCIVLINRGRKKHDKMGAMLKGKIVVSERSSRGEVTGPDPRNRPPHQPSLLWSDQG